MRLRNIPAGFLIFLGFLIITTSAQAQVQDDSWSEPIQLSDPNNSVIGAGGRPVVDRYGNIHILWASQSVIDDQYFIQYSRFNGTVWSEPIDIFTQPADATFGILANPIIDENDNIHVIFTLSTTGPVIYMRSSIYDATTARGWERLPPLNLPANRAELAIDSQGNFHIVYSKLEGKEAGIYYVYSRDQGDTWSQSFWVDPDIPTNYQPERAIFLRDEATDKLHIMYKYAEVIDDNAVGKEIRHVFSHNLGRSWSFPTIIDVADDADDELRAGGLVFNVHNDVAHVVWSGTSTTRREHRYSLDGGRTWSETERVFGELNGSAGDSLLFDGSGNLQFLGQIRFPQGMWNMTFRDGGWENPELVYLIRLSDDDEHQGIHIHAINAAVSQGNLLMATFTNAPSEGHLNLYAMFRRIDDAAFLPPLPMPTLTPSPEPTAIDQATPIPTVVATLPPELANLPEPGSPSRSIWISMIPAFGLIAIVFGVGFIKQRL